MNTRLYPLFILLILSSITAKAQLNGGADCLNADPFCTGSTINFPWQTNNGSVDIHSGPVEYGCLEYAPNPVWYYFKVGVSGDIDILIESDCGDVDFSAWGPFPSLTCSGADLTANGNQNGDDGHASLPPHANDNYNIPEGNMIDCAYSADSTESLYVPNAQVGEYYTVLITNFENCVGNLTFSQVGGTGATDCSFIICAISSITATSDACPTTNGTYSVTGNIVFEYPPATGTLTICDDISGLCKTYTAPFGNSQSYTIAGILADGLTHNLTAGFSDSITCIYNQSYTATSPNITTTASTNLCPGSNYTYVDGTSANNITVNESHVSTLVAANGCDSLLTENITVLAISTTTTNLDICIGSNYAYADGTTANNITVNESHASTLVAANGCDSVLTENITVLAISTATTNSDICFGNNYTYADGTSANNITANESHTSTLVAANGCDSVLTENISVLAISTTTTNSDICPGSNYAYADGTTANNITVNESHTSTLVAANGCDSVLTENITVLAISTTTTNSDICPGSNYNYSDGTTANNITVNESHVSTLVAANGCDSVLTENITVLAISTTTTNSDICPGSNYNYADGTTANNITANESHVSTLVAANGCDSLLTENITVLAISTATTNTNLCPGSNYTYVDGTSANNITVNESHVSTLVAANGCDSVLTENITVLAISTATTNSDICTGNNYTYADGTSANNITANESHVSTLVAANGCDSILTEHITVLTVPNITLTSSTVSICLGDQLTINATGSGSGTISWYNDPAGLNIIGTGNSFNISTSNTGTFTFYVKEVGACSSLIDFVTVTVGGVIANIDANPLSGTVPLDVTLDGSSSTEAILSYLWNFGDGGSGHQTIENNIYNNLGNYTVQLIVSDGICSDTTSITIDAFGKSTLLIPNVFTPNGDGHNDIFTVKGSNLKSIECEIYNRWGQSIYSWNNKKGFWDGRSLSGSISPAGSYFYIIHAKGIDGLDYSKKGSFILLP